MHGTTIKVKILSLFWCTEPSLEVSPKILGTSRVCVCVCVCVYNRSNISVTPHLRTDNFYSRYQPSCM